jgi:hypothetical protein
MLPTPTSNSQSSFLLLVVGLQAYATMPSQRELSIDLILSDFSSKLNGFDLSFYSSNSIDTFHGVLYFWKS